LTAVGDRLFFIVDLGSSGRQIWVSDSTAEGTLLLKDFGFAYFSLNAFGGRLFFLAQEDPEYRCELWVSDGTPEGTLLFADLSPGAGSPSPLWLTVVRDRLFIGACRSFWVSDGTPEGTAGLSSCPECGLSSCPECFSEPTAVDERLLFAAWDPEHGRELWVSDGTLEGRALVKDIHRGTIDSGAFELTPLGDRLFFILPGQQLWVSDGTQDGTVFLKDNDLPPRLSAYFPLGELTPLENRLFLRIGFQLWATDGTPEGTVLVKDVEGLGGKLAEGQGAGCSRNCPPSGLEEITAVGDRLFFCATYASSSGELWVSDGTPEGTVFLVEFRGQFYNRVYSLTGAGNRLFFVAASPDLHYTELWSSDGTGEGTVLVQEIYPGTQGTRVQQLTAVDNRVFIQVWHPDHGVELWVSDGSPEGTMLLKEDVGTELLDADLTAVADRLFFHPTDDRGHELWTSDGTPEGTVLVKDILPGTVAPSVFDALSHLTAVGDRLFFRAVDPEHGRELWVSDGTAEGTVLVEDIFPGARSSGVGAFDPIQGGLLESPDLSAIADRLFFRAADPEHGDEIWISDGTSAGTVLLADIVPGTGGSAPGHFALVGGQVFFTAQDSEHGRELWVMQLDGMARPFHRGDCNDDGTVDISDAVCILNWLFLGGAAPGCVAVTNTNGDAGEDISDATYLLNHLFLGGPAPVAPFSECGPGTLPTDERACEIAPNNCPQ
jgi:ELWxxDGT repeat protein